MVYFFVDEDGTEGCANEKPIRESGDWVGWEDSDGYESEIVILPKGTIEKVIGKVLTWEDEPYEYYGESI